MKAIIKKYFSMVEVALAIGILAVGAATVVTLFPVGMKQTKDSIGQNYSAIFADDTYAYISSLAKNSDAWKKNSTFTGAIAALPTAKPNTDNPNNVITSSQGLSKIPGTDIMEKAPGFYVISKGSQSMQDFQAQVNVWGGTISPFASILSTPSYTMTSDDINISPTGGEYEFTLTKPNGVDVFDRSSMKAIKSSSYSADFEAINIKMRIKGGATFYTNGSSVVLGDKNITLTAPVEDPIKVNIHKDTSGLGKWYIKFIGGTSTTVSNDNGDPLPSNMPAPQSEELGISKGIHVEISWPLSQANYNLRNKLKYYFEIYNMSSSWQ